MRSLVINQAFTLLICVIAFALGTVYFFQQSCNRLAKAATEKSQTIENVGGTLLWESLSNQFISAVHQ